MLRTAGLAVAVCVVLASLGPSSASGPGPTESMFDRLRGQVLADMNGDLDALAFHTTYGPDGTTNMRSLSIGDALLALEPIMRDAPSADDTSPTHAIGFGYADPAVAFALEWGFCDAASTFVEYRLDHAAPGSGFAILTPAWVTTALVGDSVCGEEAHDWDDVTIDSRAITGIKRPCGGAQVLLDYENAAFDRGLLGGILCYHDVMSAHGKGAVGTWVLGLTVIDYFYGSTAYIEIGDEPS